jgi:voltage-gated sodium channel
MSCLSNGFQNIVYVLVLFFAVIFIYGIVGFYLFSTNDPFHFGNVMLSCLQFFCLTTLENWSTVTYTNINGCDSYNSEYQYVLPSGVDVSKPVHTHFGKFYLPNCSNPEKRPILASVTLLSYIVINGYMLRELCLAVVAIGVDRRLSELKFFSLFGDEINDVRYLPPGVPSHQRLSIEEYHHKYEYITDKLRVVWGLKKTESQNVTSKFVLTWSKIRYSNISRIAKHILEDYRFSICFGMMMLLDSGLVFIESYAGQSPESIAFHSICEVFFIIQVILTFLQRFSSFTSENLKSFLNDKPAMIDFILTVIFLVPILQPYNPRFNTLKYLRVIRLFRFLLLWSTFNRSLSVAIDSFTTSYIAVCYVMCIIVITYLFYAVAGVLLFKKVNPFYFSSISKSLLTLLQIMTMDNWSDIMRKSIFGCHLYGYNTGVTFYDNTCQSTETGMGWWSPIYFVSFLIINANVLVSFVIGILISSIQLLKQSTDDHDDIQARIDYTFRRLQLDKAQMPDFIELFEFLDVRREATTVFDDLRPIANILDVPIQEIFEIFLVVDLDKSGKVDFAEFCEFVTLVGRKYADRGEAIFKSREKPTATDIYEGNTTLSLDQSLLVSPVRVAGTCPRSPYNQLRYDQLESQQNAVNAAHSRFPYSNSMKQRMQSKRGFESFRTRLAFSSFAKIVPMLSQEFVITNYEGSVRLDHRRQQFQLVSPDHRHSGPSSPEFEKDFPVYPVTYDALDDAVGDLPVEGHQNV